MERNKPELSGRYNVSHHRKLVAGRLAAVAGLSVAANFSPAVAGPVKQPVASEGRHMVPKGPWSLNWAGYEAPAPPNINLVQESVAVPKLKCPKASYYDASIWVGLGSGSRRDPLYQTGIGMSCTAGQAAYRTWWEVYPRNKEQQFHNAFPIDAGDTVIMAATITQSGVELSVQKVSSPIVRLFPDPTSTEQYNVASAPVPSTAECVTERPTYGSSFSALSDFGSVRFPSPDGSGAQRACEVMADGGASDFVLSSAAPGIPGVERLDMYNTHGQVLALASDPSSTGEYTVTWERSR